MKRGRLALALALLPTAVRSAPAAKVAEGPVADAVRRGIASGRGAFDHGAWGGLLARHVTDGRVDYAGFRQHRADLDAYLAGVGRADLGSLSRQELLALLINAYNACTVRVILEGASGERLPASIRDLADPWGRKTCALGGESVSLDTIGHGLLRPLFKDTRIHAAVNCASKSCPPLASFAFRGDRVEEQLRERMEAMVNAESHVRVEGRRLLSSKIFDWYGGDFADASWTDAAPSVAAYLLRHARPDFRKKIEALGPSPKTGFLDYDWSLNGT